jgi:Kef-type K+ transport system membrane component KefB/nucleotide-binding universal stress UspA family protein
MVHGASVVVFLAQVVTLLVCGRLLGELMQRIGQPPVMGQIVAGMLLGPSCLGALLPSLSHALFPPGAEQKVMLDALSQLGILLLLLMTGMETDLSVFRDARRTAVSISLSGIIVPFVCGVFLGSLLPDALLPDPGRRLITTLFLGTALSISSVKIVALVVRDLGFLRRTVGQLIVASAIIDDTIGWIIMSVIFGLALHNAVDFAAVSRTVVGAALFLALSFTVGRRLVLRLVRWANDSFQSEMPVISMILAITLLMALLTDAIGLHLVLGAFVAGILIGQSPMLTRHVGEQLRGLIIALFMPVFFGLAGLTTDLAVLAKPNLLQLTLGLVLLASVGKFTGAFIGGRIGGLSYRESLAVGCGMNARGSTEVIVASIGLSMGALNQSLFTAIVAMAVVTTTAMPPMLKWALRRLPMNPEEQARLQREELEAQGFVTRIERILVVVDDSPSGKLASWLVGLLAGVRRIPTTVLDFDASTSREKAATERATEAIKAGAQSAEEAVAARADEVDVTTRSEKANTLEEAIVAEAKKGYGLLAMGLEPASTGGSFDTQITRTAVSFEGPFAIAIARERRSARRSQPARQNILVPITGTSVSRDGAELAIALAQASQGSVTALYVTNTLRRSRSWRHQLGTVLAAENSAATAVREIVELGQHYGLEVRGIVRRGHPTENAIIREIDSGRYDLLVMGVSPRPAEQLFFGEVAAEVLERARCSILFLSGERRQGHRHNN